MQWSLTLLPVWIGSCLQASSRRNSWPEKFLIRVTQPERPLGCLCKGLPLPEGL